MGQRLAFECEHCGYRAEVSGGDDAGMAIVTTTIRCVQCRNLQDAVLALRDRYAHDIFGTPDDLKLRSSATLFASVSPEGSVLHRLLEEYFDGQPDPRTRQLMDKRQQADRSCTPYIRTRFACSFVGDDGIVVG